MFSFKNNSIYHLNPSSYPTLRPNPATKRSTSKRRSFERSAEGMKGYSCTLYKDYLVFFGGLDGGEAINSASVYNLKEGRMQRCQQNRKNIYCPKFNHAACYSEDKNMIIFFGGEQEPGASRYGDEHANPALQFVDEEDGGLSWHLTYGIEGPFMPSPVCTLLDRKLYAYQANQQNGNFGELRSYGLDQKRWQEFQTGKTNMRLRNPSQKAIFAQNKLYLLTENVDEKPRGVPRGGEIIEDVYVLDINQKNPEWERVSLLGKVPGLMTDVSIAEGNEAIYVFGTSYDEAKPVLWVFDTSMEKWNRIQDIGTLTARPNQRAVVYKGQLLIIDWNHVDDEVYIQYQNLGDVNYASQEPNGSKDLCKDIPENFIQDVKNLYDKRLFPDVVFEVEGEEMPAHKALLAYRSGYFMRMFTSIEMIFGEIKENKIGGMSESHSAKINIPSMKSHIFKAILQYIYCNEVELDEQLALDLIPVVDEYVMKGLKSLCEKYLCKQLRKDNVVDMLIVADRHEIEELKEACFKFILKNLGNIDENEEMMKLSKSLFIELLKFSTPGSQQKSDTKSEKEEESKSNYEDYRKSSPKKATTEFGFAYGKPTRSRSKSKGRKVSRSKSPSK